MADAVDFANELAERERQVAIANRLHGGGCRCQGPARCVRCGDKNDRRIEGFATCGDCAEGAA